jgi:dipeptidyl-peptidase-4
MFFVCCTLVCIVGTVAVPDVRSHTVKEVIPKEAESRLRAIYERGEFRTKRFRADWLDDSSGYTVLESVPGADEKVLARYDAASGKRTVLDSPKRKEASRSDKISPDGQSVLYSEQGNLYVRDLSSDRKIPLTKNAADSPVSNSRAVALKTDLDDSHVDDPQKK